MSEVVSCGRTSELATLIWIGDPTLPEFHEAFQYCVANVAQIAIRSSLAEAINRPADGVHRILITQSTRQPIANGKFERLTAIYPDALAINLVGTLCEGMRAPTGAASHLPRHAWHRWDQLLPRWLGTGIKKDPAPKSARCSVAVVASSYAAAEALMDLAESAGATAVWCRGPESHRVRNVDVVWWDDSVAIPTSSREWSERIATVASTTRSAKHVWIVQTPRLDERRNATRGGVDVVVSKPQLIDRLLETLQMGDATSSTHLTLRRHAA